MKEKVAFWRGKHTRNNTTRFALFTLAGARAKELKEFGGYSSWDNARAAEASAPIEDRIEREARAAGYKIIENPIN